MLIRMQKRQTKIRIITDADRGKKDGKNLKDQIPKLRKDGIEVRENSHEISPSASDFTPKMHNKFVIIDKTCCILGSFNWTMSAVKGNHESVIVSYDREIVSPLVKKFNRLWPKMQPLAAAEPN